jgi:L-arabinose isomerase
MAANAYLEGHHVRESNETLECWFLTGSQELYGDETLRQMAQQSGEIVALLNADSEIGVRLVPKPVLIGSAEIRRTSIEAKSTDDCIGVIIDNTTTTESFKGELRWNQAYYRLVQGLAR